MKEVKVPNKKAKQSFWQSLWTVVKKYKFAIIGSIVLSVSWFVEKVTIDDYKDEIQFVKEEREFYKSKLYDKWFNDFIVHSYEYYIITQPKFPIEHVNRAFAQVIKDREFIQVQAKVLELKPKEATKQIVKDTLYQPLIDSYAYWKQLVDSQNTNELVRLYSINDTNRLNIENETVEKANGRINRLNDKISFYRVVLLFSYAFGILFITAQRVHFTAKEEGLVIT